MRPCLLVHPKLKFQEKLVTCTTKLLQIPKFNRVKEIICELELSDIQPCSLLFAGKFNPVMVSFTCEATSLHSKEDTCSGRPSTQKHRPGSNPVPWNGREGGRGELGNGEVGWGEACSFCTGVTGSLPPWKVLIPWCRGHVVRWSHWTVAERDGEEKKV